MTSCRLANVYRSFEGASYIRPRGTRDSGSYKSIRKTCIFITTAVYESQTSRAVICFVFTPAGMCD